MRSSTAGTAGAPGYRTALALAVLVLALGLCGPGWAQVSPIDIDIRVGSGEGPRDVSLTLQILLLFTLLSVAPGLLIMTTAFTRIVIVLSFLRRALGTQTTPSNQILVGLSLFMTYFVMTPVWEQINDNAIQPYLAGQFESFEETVVVQGRETTRVVLPFEQATREALKPMRAFMWAQIGQSGSGAKEVALFMGMAKLERPKTHDDVPTHVLIPAFVIGELKKSFIMGFLLFMPFLIIDMVTASVLMSMGMMMLPPILISLPFKILLFVMVDGWVLLARAIGLSFAGG